MEHPDDAVLAEQARPVLDDIARMWRFSLDHGMAPAIKKLHHPVIWRSLLAVLIDWSVVFAALAAVLAWGWMAVLPAIIVIGNRQRALGNLLHDAAHHSFAGPGAGADRLARGLLFLPLWNSLAIYRREHFAHHRLLGMTGEDGDLIHCEADMARPWLGLWCHHALNAQFWLGSALGHLRRAGGREVGLMLAWWAALLLALGLLITPLAALKFALLWIAARTTSFHLITIFREISDHVGLRPGALISFSRNQTSGGMLAALFHPHNNGYHLLHHLNPGIPFYALPKAHEVLLAWPEYAAATHCSRYFSGKSALVNSWVRGDLAT